MKESDGNPMEYFYPYFLRALSILLCFLVFSNIVVPASVLAEPLSKTTVSEMVKMYNQGRLSKIHVEAELDRWGIDFQLSKETLDHLGALLNVYWFSGNWTDASFS